MRGDWALFWLLNTDGGTKHRRTLLQTLQQRPYPCINEPQTSKYCVFWRINEKKQIRTIFCDVYFQHKWEKWKMVRHILVALQLAACWLSLERWRALSLCAFMCLTTPENGLDPQLNRLSPQNHPMETDWTWQNRVWSQELVWHHLYNWCFSYFSRFPFHPVNFCAGCL